MCSLETYNKFRGELNRILTEGDNLMEEDEFFIELISNSKNPRGVLDLARDMKETGNFLFKQGSIEDALKNMDMLGLFLVVFTSCFSGKREFEQVGQICSIILEFSPSNVKAMFRRAMAAIELGRSDLAYWDLIMASHNDPKNPEVLEKLEEVKQSLPKEDSGKSSQGDVPIGLGLGLTPPKKKSKGELVKEHSNDQVLLHEKDMVSKPILSTMNDKCSSACSSVVEENLMPTILKGKKDEMMEDVVSVSSFGNSKLAESNYRFVNRKRSGSSLSISSKDYQLLLKGKSIQYFNSKLASPMTIRVRGGGPKNITKTNYESQEEKLDDSSIVDMKEHNLIVRDTKEE
ncbi:protein PHOX3-like [Spinacia oleracea]|uniref:Protein PHOX3-like n=1 Tax=Spinacia oleracea TaxID=3562 RepID=A0A9R0K7Z4_SPIOL|nr:protein PHOX3-like [Spinacia oleracea]